MALKNLVYKGCGGKGPLIQHFLLSFCVDLMICGKLFVGNAEESHQILLVLKRTLTQYFLCGTESSDLCFAEYPKVYVMKGGVVGFLKY